jgi:two-component system chemotaxis response regulator CheY
LPQEVKLKKILVIDDSDTIRDQLKNVFSGKPDIQVIEAENGLVGLNQLQAHPDIALIISDVNMPEMDGLTMVKRIAAAGTHVGIPIIMLTTEVSKELKDEAKLNGVRGWIIKPFTPDKLLLVTEQLLK